MRTLRPHAVTCAVALAATLLAGPAGAIGILVPSSPGLPALDLVYHRVEVEVTERGAKTKVTQEFQNRTGRQLEATYLFPLPKGATVDEFALWMNGKRETGKVLERNQARQIYESIVRRAKDPGLIEYVDAELFQARIFPIPPNGRQKVELTYSHLVDYEGGTHRYSYPMKTDARATSTLEDFTMTVRVRSKLPIRNLYSPTHTVAARARGNEGVASFEKAGFSLSDNFTLYWQVADEDVGLTVLTYKEEEDAAGYFLLLASPKDRLRDKEIIGKRVSFVVDTSGSMAGEKMDRTKRALDYCIGQLGEDDLFNVITFGGYVETFQDKMVSASGRNVKAARDFVSKIDPLGGTNIDEALTEALGRASGSKRVPHMVVFLTDGRPTVGETDTARILERVQKHNGAGARVFVFGVGDDVNTILLDRLADDNGGVGSYIREDGNIEAEIKSFYDRVSHPVLSNLSLNVSGVRVFGTHPRKLGDLFKGGQLVVHGRYRGDGKATVTLKGRTSAGSKTFSYKTTFAEGGTDHEFVARLWAQRQVGMLLSEIREKGETPGLVAEVTQLATRFGIVTPYTSYLVVEPGFGAPAEPRPFDERPTSPRRDAPSSTRGVGGAGDDLGAFAPEAEAFDFDGVETNSSSGGTKAGAPMGARPAKKARSRSIMKEESGEGAVDAAREIGRLRQQTNASDRKVATTMRRALGRTFSWADGYYVDSKSSPKDAVLEVQAYSPAFFEVLRLRPDLKDAMALGERIKVSVGSGKTLVITPDGREKVPAPQLKAFLR